MCVRKLHEIEGTQMAITFDRWVCDVDPSPRFPLYTRANVGEVFPDPVFPFTRSALLTDGAEMGWRDAWVRMGAFELERVPRRRSWTSSACSAATAT